MENNRRHAGQPTPPASPISRNLFKRPVLDLAFGLDGSTSMMRIFDAEQQISRWEMQLQTVIRTLTAAKRDERLRDIAKVHILLFDSEVKWLVEGVPLKALDLAALEAELRAHTPFGVTRLGEAVTALVGRLRELRAEYSRTSTPCVAQSMAVLMTDGNNTNQFGERCEDESMLAAYRLADELLPVNKIVLISCGIANKAASEANFPMIQRLMQADPRKDSVHVVRDATEATQWFRFVQGTLMECSGANNGARQPMSQRIDALRNQTQNHTAHGRSTLNVHSVTDAADAG